jgi:voltage-gated potassium channel
MKCLEKLKNRIDALRHDEDLKRRIYIIIFESDTPLGKAFDVALMVFIVLSIFVVIAESIQGWKAVIGPYLVVLKYALSFFGLVDLLSTLPFYIGWIFGPVRYLLIIRTFRLIRVFRVFKLFSFLNEGDMLLRSLAISSRKIGVFFLFVVILVISIGTLMYMIEGQVEGSAFRDIPSSIYWATVTLTTVGYGDITPVTNVGRFLSAFVMLLGYTIIAVPTGIVSATMVQQHRKQTLVRCPRCGRTGHEEGSQYCRFCGARLEEEEIREEEPAENSENNE